MPQPESALPHKLVVLLIPFVLILLAILFFIFRQNHLLNKDSSSVPQSIKPVNRTLLTATNIRQYNQGTPADCQQNFDLSSSSTTTKYTDIAKSVALSIPYDANWGNQQYRIDPYWEKNNGIEFGPLLISDSCRWYRPYNLEFLSPRPAQMALSYIARPIPASFLLWTTFFGCKLIKPGACPSVVFEISGSKYNYQLTHTAHPDFQELLSLAFSAIFKPPSDLFPPTC